MTKCRLLLLYLLAVATLPAMRVLAAVPDSHYMRPDRYPAQVTAIDFGSRRVTFSQPIVLEGWQVTLLPDAAAEWQDNFRPNGLRNRRGVWIPARCRHPADAGWQRCGFWFTQVVELARPASRCQLAVFEARDRRWQRSQVACVSALTLEPAALSGDPRLGPPGTKKDRRS